MKFAISAAAFLAVASVVGIIAFWNWAHREDLEPDGMEWAYRSKYFPVEGDGCQILDRTLGSDARSPKRLLEVLGWTYNEDASKNPHALGHPEFFDVQHQALVRLLALQEDRFGIVPDARHTSTLLVDHTGAKVVEVANGVHVVDGSASIYPNQFDEHPWEGYFTWERFKFEQDGRLVERLPLNQ
jgi:hypothetical protein